MQAAIPTSTQVILNAMYHEAKQDGLKVAKALAKSIITKVKPSDVGTAYLPISQEQGEYLHQLICEKNFKSIVEFGTSFGISTLYLAEAVKQTDGKVITTEIVPEKCRQANSTFEKAGLDNYISLLEGDALETLKQVNQPVDLLMLDGWKELYLPVFRMLEPFFHKNTLVFVDNTNMKGVKHFVKEISKETEKYLIKPLRFDKGNTVLISHK
ncbi:MAG: class I SAM-dependent methyltransferase [Flavobacteriales bacterium]|nr:class I SAM-dependent methyltransferase [Flavobacteriaceae bacterium]MDP4952880.1 class I SAM-dependent methyltransferase [Flavobacteriales bacterium]